MYEDLKHMEKRVTEINYMGEAWKGLQEVAIDRQAWQELIDGVCLNGV